jgi:DHA2 family multidrug resistance protein
MSDRAPAASAAQAVASHPPLSIAITTIGVIAVAMVGSTISSQLVDLDIADIGGGFSVSADDASWIASVATMSEVVSIPIAAILVRALSLRRVAVYSAALYVVCACLSLFAAGEDGLMVLRATQSYCSGTMSVLMFVSVVATLPPGFARNIGLAPLRLRFDRPDGAQRRPAPLSPTLGLAGSILFRHHLGSDIPGAGWRFSPGAASDAPVGDRLARLCHPCRRARRLDLFMKQGDRFFWLDNPIIRHADCLPPLPYRGAVLFW